MAAKSCVFSEEKSSNVREWKLEAHYSGHRLCQREKKELKTFKNIQKLDTTKKLKNRAQKAILQIIKIAG